MKKFSFPGAIGLLLAALPAMAEFEDLQLLPPPEPLDQAAAELDPACIDDPVIGPERGKFIIDNHEALRARVVMIEQANCEILIEYYTVASDRISIAGLALLIEAANRGVKVKVLLDGITHRVKTALVAATLFHPRARQNIEIRVFNPFVLLFPRTWLARLHDKVIVVDGHRLITGGRNVSNKYYGIEPGGYFDADIYLEGGLGSRVRSYFYGLWNSDLVRPIRLFSYNFDNIDYCRQDVYQFDKPCRQVRRYHIPRLVGYMDALDEASARLNRGRSELAAIAAAQQDLTREMRSIPGAGAELIESFAERDDGLRERSREIRQGLMLDIMDNRPVITQAELDSGQAFVVNGPVQEFYDEPEEKKSIHGVASQLRNFFENRVKPGAEITVFSPYIVLGRIGQDLVTYLLQEKQAKITFYTNSALSSDNLFAQAFYRHPDSKDFLIESGVEVFEFKGYRGQHEEQLYKKTRQKTTIHFKAALIENPGENPIILLGTYNVDLRSAHYNREFVAVIDVQASAPQVRVFKDLAKMVHRHGYRAGLEKYDENGEMSEWYREYRKTPAWKRGLMKILRGLNNLTLDWLRKQA